MLPCVAQAVWRIMKRSEFVNLRGPGHFSLVGTVLAFVLRKPSLTKWAGVNDSYRGEPLACKFERYLHSIPSQTHLALVYGLASRPHHISFFPALMSDDELELARRMSSHKVWAPPWRILCVGRLSGEKAFDLAIRGLGELKRIHPELLWEFRQVGDGPERKRLEVLSDRCGIGDRVSFTGALAFREVQHHYAKAHFVIQPNSNEGWGKVIAEAWAHGAIPVVADGRIVPHILRERGDGAIFEPDTSSLAEVLANLLGAPQRIQIMALGAYANAERLSLSRFSVRLQEVLEHHSKLR